MAMPERIKPPKLGLPEKNSICSCGNQPIVNIDNSPTCLNCSGCDLGITPDILKAEVAKLNGESLIEPIGKGLGLTTDDAHAPLE